MQAAAALRSLRCLLLLHGTADDTSISRFSFLTAEPAYTLSGRGSQTLKINSDGTIEYLPSDVLTAAQHILRDRSMAALPGLPPFQTGFAGYIGYEFGEELEPSVRAHGHHHDDHPSRDIPNAALAWYDWVLAWDHLEQRTWLIAESETAIPQDVLEHLSRPIQESETSPTTCLPPEDRTEFRAKWDTTANRIGLTSSLDRPAFMAAVERIREYIRAGDVFQANLSQQFSAPYVSDPWSLFRHLARINPTPFAAYFESPHGTIVSASPERFVSADPSGIIETRPIKGTRPRGLNKDQDKLLSSELLLNEKERAEHVMIVDVLRNDLGRSCEFGSVVASDLFRIEHYASVHHMVSTIRGHLKPGYDALDMIRFAFPGGSITGAPKIRAMQIIRELEPTPRGVYCGLLGYFSVTGAIDTNITIRTCVVDGGRIRFSAGGGIVADSDPAAEFDETLAKAYPILQAIAP